MMHILLWMGSVLLAVQSKILVQYNASAMPCGQAPVLDGTNVDALISANTGVLIIGMSNMQCTIAVKNALTAKGVTFTEKQFGGATMTYARGNDTVWDYLHCKYPDDRQGTTIMHSYVFHDQEFLGQGFKVADDINAGTLNSKLGITAGTTDCSQLPDASHSQEVVDNYLKSGPVVMFGWLGCQCVQTAQTRFAAKNLCVEERTWALENAPLMRYLQCNVSDTSSHSFIFFKQQDGSMRFIGNGFQFADDAMDDSTLTSLITEAGAQTNCAPSASSQKVNIYGGILAECRVGTDAQGSWMDDGTCSEATGGVHQICLEQIPADFSEETGQSPWSRDRAGKRHCVCIGAWSLYMTKEETNPVMPHCEAIPSTIFSETYIANWKDWNGVPAEIATGMSKLVEKCLTATTDNSKKCALKENFEGLKAKESSLANANPAGLSALSCSR